MCPLQHYLMCPLTACWQMCPLQHYLMRPLQHYLMHNHLHLRGYIFRHFRSDWPFWFWLISVSFSQICKSTSHQQYLTFHCHTYNCFLTLNVVGILTHEKLNSVTRQCSFLSISKNKVELPVPMPWRYITWVEGLLHSFVTTALSRCECSVSFTPWKLYPKERTLVPSGWPE